MSVQLTVVVPWVNRGPWINECLERLEAQTSSGDMQVVVYTRFPAAETSPLADRFPRVRFEAGLEGASIPAMRWRGMREATTNYVAVIEDHILPPADWATRIIDTHAAGHDVVAGPIENASKRTVFDWAFFLIEYADVMPPTETGDRQTIAGGNVSYRKSALPLDDVRFSGLWESFLLDYLRSRGAKVLFDSNIAVGHLNPFRFREFAGQKFLYSRSFAAMRARGWGIPRRVAYAAAAALVLPFVLPLRLARSVFRKRRYRGKLLIASPLILVLFALGIAGEIGGYEAGDGGSLARVR